MNSLYNIIVLVFISTLALERLGYDLLGLNVNITNFTLVLLLTLFIISKCYTQKIKIPRNIVYINYLALVFIVTMFLSYLATSDLERFITFFSAMLIFLLVGNYLHLVKRQWLEVAAYLTTMIAIAFAIGHYLDYIPVFEFEKTAYRENFEIIKMGYTGLIPSRGSYGILLLTGLVISHFWFKKKRLRELSLISIIIICFAAFITLSRSTWLAFLIFYISLIVIFYFLYARYIRPRSVYYFIGIVICIIISISIFQSVIDFYGYIKDIQETSVQHRIYQYNYALEQAKHYPVFGTGYLVTKTGEIHNSFLAILMERGWLNFVLFSFIIGILIVNLIISIKKSNTRQDTYRFTVLLSGLIAVLVEANLYRGYISNTLMFYLAFVLGNLYQVQKIPKKCKHSFRL